MVEVSVAVGVSVVVGVSLVELVIHMSGRWQATRATKRVQVAVRKELFDNHGSPNKIAAIKLYRTLTGAGLKESKEWVENTYNV